MSGTYLVTSTSSAVNFGATGVTEILQNVRTIMNTAKLSVPLDRAFGVDATLIDLPMPVAKAKLAAEIVEAVQKYEPRVTISKVTFEGDTDNGLLIPKAQVYIND